MDNLFDRAKQIGLQSVKSWIPGGRIQGDEWVVRNPTRNDEHEGSFSVNLITGEWADFSDYSARGRDCVSLYAYIHRSSIENKAHQRQYKNFEGGVQAEAAREILEMYDPTYFPTDGDRFEPPVERKTGDHWEGFYYLQHGHDSPPELKTSWFEDKWGKAERTWFFTDIINGKTITLMACVRFRDQNGKKNDRPFTMWKKGDEIKWRAKAPDEKIPLYGLGELKARPNSRIVLTEGQKAASVLAPVLLDWVCLGWYGGTNQVNKQDWEPTRGCEIWFPFDGDAPGRKVLAEITKIAQEYQWKLHIVYPPLAVPKGWDLADAVESGWDKEKIEAHLLADKPVETIDDTDRDIFIDDPDAFDLRVLGFSGEHIVIYPYGQCRIVKLKPAGLTKATMIGLQDKTRWKDLFGSDNGIRWDDAQNHLIRVAETLPIFDQNLVRGAGAWLEDGELVLNDGSNIIKNGKCVPLYKHKSRYVYERSKSIPYLAEKPLDIVQAAKIIEILNLVAWKRTYIDPLLMAGWLLLAPFCGALKWRPHLWITGGPGSGKTWVMDNIVIDMVVSMFGVHGKGTSTAPGVRHELGGGALPFGMDEMESDNKKQQEMIEQILKIFREASGGNESSATLHAGESGAKHWNVVSMAAFASIGAAIKHGADRSRFVVIDMSVDRKHSSETKARQFALLEKMKNDVITPAWSKAFVARTISIWPEVQKAITVCVNTASKILNSRRDGDRLGTLLAGAWMVTHDDAPTASEALSWIEHMNIEDLSTESSMAPDEQLCLEEIMSSQITLDNSNQRRTIGSLIESWYHREIAFMSVDQNQSQDSLQIDEVKRSLQQYGIKLSAQGMIQIARNHPAIKKMLKETAWVFNYDDVMKRLPYCQELTRSPARFAGMQYRYLELDAKGWFGFAS